MQMEREQSVTATYVDLPPFSFDPHRHHHPNLHNLQHNISLAMPRLPIPQAIGRAQQPTTRSSNGYASFIPSVRKLVFEYCDTWPSSANLRTYIWNHVEDVARQNPHVEVVVKQRPSKEPVVRGFYRACHPVPSLCRSFF
jgi:hypothetical protein